MSEDTYGPIVSDEQIRAAAVQTCEAWMPEYLANLERKNGLAKGAIARPQSYHGGVDWDSWIGEVLPEVMVLVKPTGLPERTAALYVQRYELWVGCACIGQQTSERAEDEARVAAAYLGAASMLLVQGERSSLGGLAEQLEMTSAPEVSVISPEHREVLQVRTGFELRVPGIVSEFAGLVGATPKESEGYTGPEQENTAAPTVTTTALTVKGEPV